MITIITVCRNSGDSLRDTIESVNRLGRDDLRYILVDGASTDGSLEVARKSDRVDDLISESDEGIYDAMNKGWGRAAEHGHVLFLGAGDKIQSLPSVPDMNKVYYGTTWMGDRKYVSSLRYGLRRGNSLHHQSLLIPKNLHPNPPFKTKYPCYADFDFNQRLLKSGAVFEYSEDLIAYAKPDGVSSVPRVLEMSQISLHNLGLSAGIETFVFSLYSRLCYELSGRPAG